jgi:hypothetical protein
MNTDTEANVVPSEKTKKVVVPKGRNRHERRALIALMRKAKKKGNPK